MSLAYRHVHVLKGGVQAWTEAGYAIVDRAPVPSLFGRVLVPLDGSPASEAVLYQAERLLCGRKGEVILFHAWDSGSTDFASPEEAGAYLRSVEKRLSSGGCSIRHLVGNGPLEKSLPAAIASERVSLVALSSHGRETSAREPVADVIEGVLEKSHVPVFVARAYRPGGLDEVQPAECEAPTIRRILVPLDGSSACEAVMPYARELGQLLGALIVILHVRPEERSDPGNFLGSRISGRPSGPVPGENASVDERIEYAAKTFSAAGLETMTLNLGGDPGTAILNFARPSAVDLIAMTTHGRSGLSKLLLGSVAGKVLKEAILPTLVVTSDANAPAQCLT
ncbi:MAG TPA: universal stress protein [Planctomycetota bacterium]|jgi:nucleotide-binding universal stress UspA family protein|nr:universal stress protein [Planctomycetota bacterium]